MAQTVYASAPSRIDFGGGTLDIYPLYLFFGGGLTINAAIDLTAQVWLTQRDDERISIASLDTGATLDCDGPVQRLPMAGPLALITRVLRHYGVEGGIDVKTQLLPPHGSGLGASSTLFIALSHAVLAYQGKPCEPARIIRVSNHLEAQLMGMPAGIQDYYPPTYGGMNAVHYDIDETWVESLDPDGLFTPELQRHLIVTYTNITHHSGTTNWMKMRNYFDGVPRTVESLSNIKATALRFYDAFRLRDVQAIAQLLNEEWENRKGLADGVTTPEIDHMMDAAHLAGAWGSKLCGAGGGGCMLTIAPPEQRDEVIAALEAQGARYLHASLVQEGVHVDASDGDVTGC
ncbi:MAG TPA: hypothetical protein VGL77_19285 [Armatimonadota bacterium]|jgi:D-glycero-alpha-D-manno-heptose-7-phosphate kinase